MNINEIVVKGEVVQDSPAFLLRKLIGAQGEKLTQADVESIDVEVYDVYDMTTPVQEFAVDVADAVYDTWQTDRGWRKDAEGYNLAIACAGDCFPNYGRSRYLVRVTVTPASSEYIYGGDAFRLVWLLDSVQS